MLVVGHMLHPNMKDTKYEEKEGLPETECDKAQDKYYESTHTQNEAINSRLEGFKEFRSFECLVCGKRFKENFLLKRHALIHTGERPFACMYCPKTFNQDSACKNHEAVHRGHRHFECPQCDRKFTTKSHLTHHLTKSHAPSKDFDCVECPKKFTTQGCLNQHMRKCHGPVKYECTTCQVKFRMGQSFRKHLKSKLHHRRLKHLNSGAPLFNCVECSKKFMTQGILNEHTRRCHGPLKFECTTCQLKFRVASTFRIHLTTKSHHLKAQLNCQKQEEDCSIIIFDCKICSKSYKTRARLTRHEERRGHAHVKKENFKLLTTTSSSVQKMDKTVSKNSPKKEHNDDTNRNSVMGKESKLFSPRNSSLVTPTSSPSSSWSSGPHECPVCPKNFKTIPKLGQHISKHHNTFL